MYYTWKQIVNKNERTTDFMLENAVCTSFFVRNDVVEQQCKQLCFCNTTTSLKQIIITFKSNCEMLSFFHYVTEGNIVCKRQEYAIMQWSLNEYIIHHLGWADIGHW